MVTGRENAPYLLLTVSPETSGTSRWLYDMLADDCGIRAADVRVVTLLDEEPSGASGAPKKSQINEREAAFRAEIASCRGVKVVIAMGAEVFRASTGLREGIEDARGYVLNVRGSVRVKQNLQVGLYKTTNRAKGYLKGDPRMRMVDVDAPPPIGTDVPLIATYSTRQVEKSGFKLMFALKNDLMRAAAVGTGRVQYDDGDFGYYTSLAQDGARFDYVADLLAFDIETAGIGSKVVMRISLSDGERSHTLPWNAETCAWVQRQFDLAVERKCLLVAHNGMFDIPLLKSHGCYVPMGYWMDSMIAAVQLQPDLPKGLGRVAPLYLNLREPWKWGQFKDEDEEHYSAKDSFITAKLGKMEVRLLKMTGWHDRFINVIMQRIPVLMELGDGGIRVDVGQSVAWSRRLQRRLIRYMNLWGKSFPNANPFSSPQITKFLYKELELPEQRGKRGGLTADELACVNLRQIVEAGTKAGDTKWEQDPRITPRVFDLLLKLRYVSKELKTYAKVRLDEKHRVYPQYLPESKDYETNDGSKRKGAAATGRLASRGPNLQNQSKAAKMMYIPDHDDFCFVQGDYVSAEAFMLAARSGDRALMQALLAGQFHQKNADRIGCAKRTAKNTFYGTCYGAGPQKISDTIKKEDHMFVPVDEVRRTQRGLRELYPVAFAYLDSLGTIGVEQGYLVNAFGRVRFFYGKTRDIPAMKDYDPQSNVADVVWDVMLPVANMFRELGGRFTSTTHDSFLGQVHRSKAHEAARRLKEIMECVFDNVAPGFVVPAEVEVGAPGAAWGTFAKDDFINWDGEDDE